MARPKKSKGEKIIDLPIEDRDLLGVEVAQRRQFRGLTPATKSAGVTRAVKRIDVDRNLDKEARAAYRTIRHSLSVVAWDKDYVPTALLMRACERLLDIAANSANDAHAIAAFAVLRDTLDGRPNQARAAVPTGPMVISWAVQNAAQGMSQSGGVVISQQHDQSTTLSDVAALCSMSNNHTNMVDINGDAEYRTVSSNANSIST